ncbi:MAG: hypothetical protein ACN4G0_06240 [Polyangiales bacterium]
MVGLLLLTASCTDDSSSQIVVLMDTDFAVPGEVDRIHARVLKMVDSDAGTAEVETWAHTFPVTDGASDDPSTYTLPASFSVLPAGEAEGQEVVIELEALAAGGTGTLVSRRVVTGFVPGEARLVRMLLFRACSGQTCEAGQSCGCADAAACSTPRCVDEAVDPYVLEPMGNPGALPGDAGIPVGDGGSINCEAPLLLCGTDCVNPLADPRYCGDCETSCPTGFVCEAAECEDPGDCRTNGVGCSGFTYCDEQTGDCLPGCVEAEQCSGEHEVCDIGMHDCVCTEDFDRCEGGCVNTEIDPNYCGDCMTSCDPGDVCLDGGCRDPGDCRFNGDGCSGFTYCEQETGECLRGCEDDEQCVEAEEICDTDIHDCVCREGFHRCGPVCVSNEDVDTCGDLCTPCLAPSNASPICAMGACDFVCDDDYVRCDDICCPTSCPPGQVLYGGACAETHVQLVAGAGNVGEYSSLALDSNGLARISHYASSGRALLVSEQGPDASWVLTSPDSSDEVGMHTSIAFDGDGLPQVAYYNASNKDLMLAQQNASGVWTVEVVDGQQGDMGKYASLAFDAGGATHISYYDEGNKNLMYATRQVGEDWDFTVVDQDEKGQYTSLALSQSGVPYISYYDADTRNLRLASQEQDGSWRTRTIASTGDVGKYSSLAFDPLGTLHISYYDETNRDLIYATEAIAGFWIFEAVESVPNVGKYSSLAFDAQRGAHVSYYDETDRDLKVAHRLSNGTWSIQPVDTVGDVGRYTSIAIDALGQAHVSYYDVTNRDLKYALIAASAPPMSIEQ